MKGETKITRIPKGKCEITRIPKGKCEITRIIISMELVAEIHGLSGEENFAH